MSGNGVIQIFPLGFPWETSDPFLFCVHHLDHFPVGNDEMGPPAESLKGRNIGSDFTIKDGWRMYHGDKVPGFPQHPHRGFETVTVVQRGMVDHSDSIGAAGRYGGGDTQWMTAGEGIQHAEMFPLLNKDKDNTMELFQIWLNLPAANKMVKPHFTMLWREDIPVVTTKDDQGRSTEMTIVAGALEGAAPPSPPPNSWASDPANSLLIWVGRLEPHAEWSFQKAAAGLNRTIYFFEGDSLNIDGQDVAPYHGVTLRSELATKLANGPAMSRVLILQGKPIGEKVVQHGPFVMNSEAEIRQAFADFRKTGFGDWPWPSSDPIHSRDKGRFAKHADGRLETKNG